MSYPGKDKANVLRLGSDWFVPFVMEHVLQIPNFVDSQSQNAAGDASGIRLLISDSKNHISHRDETGCNGLFPSIP
jgi:hypothetical protein